MGGVISAYSSDAGAADLSLDAAAAAKSDAPVDLIDAALGSTEPKAVASAAELPVEITITPSTGDLRSKRRDVIDNFKFIDDSDYDSDDDAEAENKTKGVEEKIVFMVEDRVKEDPKRTPPIAVAEPPGDAVVIDGAEKGADSAIIDGAETDANALIISGAESDAHAVEGAAPKEGADAVAEVVEATDDAKTTAQETSVAKDACADDSKNGVTLRQTLRSVRKSVSKSLRRRSKTPTKSADDLASSAEDSADECRPPAPAAEDDAAAMEEASQEANIAVDKEDNQVAEDESAPSKQEAGDADEQLCGVGAETGDSIDDKLEVEDAPYSFANDEKRDVADSGNAMDVEGDDVANEEPVDNAIAAEEMSEEKGNVTLRNSLRSVRKSISKSLRRRSRTPNATKSTDEDEAVEATATDAAEEEDAGTDEVFKSSQETTDESLLSAAETVVTTNDVTTNAELEENDDIVHGSVADYIAVENEEASEAAPTAPAQSHAEREECGTEEELPTVTAIEDDEEDVTSPIVEAYIVPLATETFNDEASATKGDSRVQEEATEKDETSETATEETDHVATAVEATSEAAEEIEPACTTVEATREAEEVEPTGTKTEAFGDDDACSVGETHPAAASVVEIRENDGRAAEMVDLDSTTAAISATEEVVAPREDNGENRRDDEPMKEGDDPVPDEDIEQERPASSTRVNSDAVEMEAEDANLSGESVAAPVKNVNLRNSLRSVRKSLSRSFRRRSKNPSAVNDVDESGLTQEGAAVEVSTAAEVAEEEDDVVSDQREATNADAVTEDTQENATATVGQEFAIFEENATATVEEEFAIFEENVHIIKSDDAEVTKPGDEKEMATEEPLEGAAKSNVKLRKSLRSVRKSISKSFRQRSKNPNAANDADDSCLTQDDAAVENEDDLHQDPSVAKNDDGEAVDIQENDVIVSVQESVAIEKDVHIVKSDDAEELEPEDGMDTDTEEQSEVATKKSGNLRKSLRSMRKGIKRSFRRQNHAASYKNVGDADLTRTEDTNLATEEGDLHAEDDATDIEENHFTSADEERNIQTEGDQEICENHEEHEVNETMDEEATDADNEENQDSKEEGKDDTNTDGVDEEQNEHKPVDEDQVCGATRDDCAPAVECNDIAGADDAAVTTASKKDAKKNGKLQKSLDTVKNRLSRAFAPSSQIKEQDDKQIPADPATSEYDAAEIMDAVVENENAQEADQAGEETLVAAYTMDDTKEQITACQEAGEDKVPDTVDVTIDDSEKGDNQTAGEKTDEIFSDIENIASEAVVDEMDVVAVAAEDAVDEDGCDTKDLEKAVRTSKNKKRSGLGKALHSAKKRLSMPFHSRRINSFSEVEEDYHIKSSEINTDAIVDDIGEINPEAAVTLAGETAENESFIQDDVVETNEDIEDQKEDQENQVLGEDDACEEHEDSSHLEGLDTVFDNQMQIDAGDAETNESTIVADTFIEEDKTGGESPIKKKKILPKSLRSLKKRLSKSIHSHKSTKSGVSNDDMDVQESGNHSTMVEDEPAENVDDGAQYGMEEYVSTTCENEEVASNTGPLNLLGDQRVHHISHIPEKEAQSYLVDAKVDSEVSVKTEVMVNVSAKVSVTPTELPVKVVLNQLDISTEIASEATEDLEKLIEKSIVEAVENAIEDATQGQDNVGEFIVSEVKIVYENVEDSELAKEEIPHEKLEKSESDDQMVQDSLEVNVNTDANEETHINEEIETGSLLHSVNELLAKSFHSSMIEETASVDEAIAVPVREEPNAEQESNALNDESSIDVDGGIYSAEDLSTDDATLDSASEEESCDLELKSSPRSTLEKVSQNLQKAQKRLSKSFGKKPAPATPDSAIAECMDEEHISCGAETENETDFELKLESTTLEAPVEDPSKTVCEADAPEETKIEERKSSGLGSFMKKIKVPKRLFKKKGGKSKDVQTEAPVEVGEATIENQVAENNDEEVVTSIAEEVAMTTTEEVAETITEEVAESVVDAVETKAKMTETTFGEQLVIEEITEATFGEQLVIEEEITETIFGEQLVIEEEIAKTTFGKQLVIEEEITEATFGEQLVIEEEIADALIEDADGDAESIAEKEFSETGQTANDEASPVTTVDCLEETPIESTEEPIPMEPESQEKTTSGLVLRKVNDGVNQYTAKMPNFEEKLRKLSIAAACEDIQAENVVEIQLKLAQLKSAEIVSAGNSENAQRGPVDCGENTTASVSGKSTIYKSEDKPSEVVTNQAISLASAYAAFR